MSDTTGIPVCAPPNLLQYQGPKQSGAAWKGPGPRVAPAKNLEKRPGFAIPKQAGKGRANKGRPLIPNSLEKGRAKGRPCGYSTGPALLTVIVKVPRKGLMVPAL